MKITLKRLDDFCGDRCKFYQIILDDDSCLFDEFVKDHNESHHKEIIQVLKKMKVIANKVGARDHLLKINEGIPGDGVCALYDKKQHLRLYCIRYFETLIILGYGGVKPDGAAYQSHPHLNDAASTVKIVSQKIREATSGRFPQIKIEPDGELSGDLTIEIFDYECN